MSYDKQKPRWQPIEIAPRDGTKVDLWGQQFSVDMKKLKVYVRDELRRTNCFCEDAITNYWTKDDGSKYGYQMLDFKDTHWMPIPAPPSVKNDQ